MDASTVTKGVGGALSTTLGALLAWVMGSGALPAPLSHVLAILGAVCGLAFALLSQRYFGVLAASEKPAGNDERAGYDELRVSLAAGGTIQRLYAERLTRFLDWVERFFGDAGMAERTLFPRAFGLKTPAPLWTAPAYDRCLLLAFVYPIVTIFVIWVISGHVGPAEAALGMKSQIPGWRRLSHLFSVWCCGYLIHGFFQAKGLEQFISLGFVFVIVASAGPTMPVFLCVIMSIGAVAVPAAGAGPVLVGAVGSIVLNIALVRAAFEADGVVLLVLVLLGLAAGFGLALSAGYGVTILSARTRVRGREGHFLTLFTLIMIVVCLGAVYPLATFDFEDLTGPMLLFLGLLTLINAPFDWASLGLTRALLRRGLDLKGWWPLALALIDAASAALIVALLAIAMVVGVQAFDTLAVLGGGKAVLPLEPLFAALRKPETALEPEYWWLYALLLTTLIPSLINLGIGGASVMQMLPFVRSLLLKHMPAEKPVRSYERAWMALLLAAQPLVGIVLGILVQAVIFWFVIVYAMPLFGLGLLDMAEGLAALDLPARFLSLW